MSDPELPNLTSPRRDADIALAPSGPALGERAPTTVVLVAEPVWEQMRQHGRVDTSREQGGLLVGTTGAGRTRLFVSVEATIPAPQVRSDRTSITFTHESWAQINSIKDNDYPDQDIVGWYHTHPGFGIFLSDYDLFIQRNFFAAPWQVAVVLDPASGESGVFAWDEEQIVRLPQDQVLSVHTGEKAAAPELPAPVRASRGAVPWLAAAGIVLLTILMVMLIMMRSSAPPGAAPGSEAALAARLAAVENDLAAARAQLAQLAQKLTPSAPPGPAPAAAKPVPKLVPNKPASRSHTVERGDSLWRIARRYYGRGELYPLIAKENHIRPGQHIYRGQVLRLPPIAEGPRASQ